MTDERRLQLIAEQKAKFEKNLELLHGEEHSLENTTIVCTNATCKHSQCRFHKASITRHLKKCEELDLFNLPPCRAEIARLRADSHIAAKISKGYL